MIVFFCHLRYRSVNLVNRKLSILAQTTPILLQIGTEHEGCRLLVYYGHRKSSCSLVAVHRLPLVFK